MILHAEIQLNKWVTGIVVFFEMKITMDLGVWQK